MRPSQLVRKKVIIGVAVAVSLCVAVDRAVYFRNQCVRSLDVRIADSELELRSAMRILQLRNVIESDVEELFLNGDPDNQDDTTGLIGKLDTIAREAGMSVSSLRPGIGGNIEEVALVLKGRWMAVVKFFTAVQARPYYFDLREMKIVLKDRFQPELEVECVLSKVGIK